MKLYFIRHTAVDVPQGVCYGQSDVPVKETFEAEATLVKNNLKDIDFDIVYSSPLSRCYKLAKFCGFENISLQDSLKEMHFGEWEMMEWDDIHDENIDEWYENWIHCPTTGGESFKIQYDRVASFIDEVRKLNYNNVAIFTHAGVINCARVYVGDTTLEDAFQWIPTYGEIVCIEVDKQ